jgi:phospholipid transport system substrate-binding protein
MTPRRPNLRIKDAQPGQKDIEEEAMRGLCGALASVALVAFAIGLSPPAAAQVADPAAARIEAFDASIIETMKDGPTLGAQGRYRKLTPVVERAFDLPLMTRFAVGPEWAKMSEAEHRSLIAAFTRLTAASYAHNFDRYEGERFTVDPTVQTRGADKIVQAHLLPAHGAPVALTYRMRQNGGAWTIVDVVYGSVSQLTTRRADFAASLAAGGAAALVSHLDALVAKLLA